jgi:hypothetical protein
VSRCAALREVGIRQIASAHPFFQRKEKGDPVAVQILGHVKANYEVQGLEMGTVYRWCPESVVIECECGEKPSLAASRTTCSGCGANHMALTEEVLDIRQEDKVEYPWRSLRPYYLPIRGT